VRIGYEHCTHDPTSTSLLCECFLAAPAGGVWADIASGFAGADTLRIGGDEFQGCWADCPAVMDWIHSTFGPQGTIEDAYHYYERRLIGIARAHGRSVQAWLDIAGWPDKAKNETWAGNYSDVTLNVWTGCYSGEWDAAGEGTGCGCD